MRVNEHRSAVRNAVSAVSTLSQDSFEDKLCRRCGASFECKAGSILLCQCAGVRLTDEELAHIQARFESCLCVKCLQALKAEMNAMPSGGR